MKMRSDPDLAITAWLVDDARDGAPERLVEATRRQLERTNQRRAVRPAWRLSPMNSRIVIAAAVVVIAVAAGFFVLPRFGGPAAVATPTPSPTVPPHALRSGVLAAGSYITHPYETTAPKLAITFTVPDGWAGFPNWAVLSPSGTRAPAGVGLGFLSASGVFSDPCHWDTNGMQGSPQEGDVVVGPTAADLASALASQAAYTSTTPTNVTLAGYSGKEMELQLPSDIDFAATCDKYVGQTDGSYWVWSATEATGNNLYAQGPGERRHLWILDVEGKRLIIETNDYAGSSPVDRAAARQIIDSIVITP